MDKDKDKAKRIACHRCRSKHLKCNGAWPSCGRCDTLGLHCRYQSPVRFVYWTEQEFQANQRWVRSSARTFCIDKSVPSAAWSTLNGLLDHSEDDAPPGRDGRGSPGSVVSDHDSTAELWEDITELPDADADASHLPQMAPRESPRLRPVSVPLPESHQQGFLEDTGLSLEDLGASKLSESPHVLRGPADNHAAYSDKTSPSVPTPSTSQATDPLTALSQTLLRYFHVPSISQDPFTSSSSVSNPTTHIPSLKTRKFPLVDFLEAYLFKYFIDDVAPWLDIADPDRYFELVVPIIARSNPPLLCAVLALAARHLLSAPPGPEPRARRCYKAAVRARISTIAVIELIIECLPSLHAYDASPEDERPGLLTALVLLRQAELLDRDCSPADRCFTSAADADTFLPVFNAVVQGPEFERMMRRSGLAQAAYMLALRQEMYYSMASGRPPAVALAGCPPFHPFAYEMTVNMIKVLGACWCNERAGRAPAEVLDQLMQRQRDLKNDILLGIRPIFEHRSSSAEDAIPTLWYASKTEVYLVQLSKIALAILVNSRPRDELSDVMNGRNHVDAMKDLLRDTFAIALGRGESPHAMFHASMMAKLLKDTPAGQEAVSVLQRSTERLKEMKIWPFRHIVELHWS